MMFSIGDAAPITVYRTIFGCVLFWCWISIFCFFTNVTINVYFIMVIISIIGMFMSMAIPF